MKVRRTNKSDWRRAGEAIVVGWNNRSTDTLIAVESGAVAQVIYAGIADHEVVNHVAACAGGAAVAPANAQAVCSID